MKYTNIKYKHEYGYWLSRFRQENDNLSNSHFASRMLLMAQEENDEFLRGKIVADFGCGPRGSLSWTSAPLQRIGIDVLIPEYLASFGNCMREHDMTYITCTEKIIPIQSSIVDVMFTINALDHVDDFQCMTHEILRILKPGGLFIGSLNLNQPATPCEPQTLTDISVRKSLLKFLNLSSYRLAKIHPKTPYKLMLENKLSNSYENDEQYILWVKGTKK